HHLADEGAGPVQGVVFEQAVGGGGLGQGEGAADGGVQLALGQPAVDVVGAAALLGAGGVEHGEAGQRQPLDVEGAGGEDRLGLAAGDDDDPAALGHQVHGAQEVRLALGLVPDVYALAAGVLADPGRDVVGLVVEDAVGAPAAAQLGLLRRADGGDDVG